MNKQFLHISFALLIGGGIYLLTGCARNLDETGQIAAPSASFPVRTLTATTADEDTSDDSPAADTKGYWHYIADKANFYWTDGETLSCAIHSQESDWYDLTAESSKIATITANRKMVEGSTDKQRATFTGSVTSEAAITEGDFIYYTNGTISPTDPSTVSFKLPNAFSRKGGNEGDLSPYMFIYGKSSIVSATSEEITSGSIAFKHIPSTFRFILNNQTGKELNITGFKVCVLDDADRAKPVFPKAYTMTVVPSSEDPFTLKKDESSGHYSELSLDIYSASSTYVTVKNGDTYDASLLFFPATFDGEKLVIKVKYDGRQEYTTLKTVKLNSLTTKSGVIYNMPLDLVETPSENEDTWYNDWQNGKNITIGGIAYNKETCGDGTLLSESNSNITADGVYFVPEGVTATYSNNNGINKLIVIGNSKTARSNFSNSSQMRLLVSNPVADSYALFYNLNFDTNQYNGHTFIPYHTGGNAADAGGYFGKLVIDYCEVVLPYVNNLINAGSGPNAKTDKSTRVINDIRISNSKIQYPINQYYIISVPYGLTYPSVSFVNNIIWNSVASGSQFRLCNFGGQDTGSTISNLEISNNTMVNIMPTGTKFLVQAKEISKASIVHNIFYSQSILGTTYVIIPNSGSNPGIFEASDNWSNVPTNTLSSNKGPVRYKLSKVTITSGTNLEDLKARYTPDSPVPFATGWNVTEGYFPVNRTGNDYKTAGSTLDD